MPRKKGKQIPKKKTTAAKVPEESFQQLATINQGKIVKRYKKASNPAVEEAVSAILSHKYSTQDIPNYRTILSNIKGCDPQDVTENELKQVRSIVYTRRNKLLKNDVPFYCQAHHAHWMFVEKVPMEILNAFPEINKFIKSKASKFWTIYDTKQSLKQFIVNDKLLKIKIKKDDGDTNLMDLFKKFFKELVKSKKLPGVLVEDLKTHALFTNSDEEHHQRPHTDFAFPKAEIQVKLPLGKRWLAWTAIVPTNELGSCLNVWKECGYPVNIPINFGEIFFFRSDVIHSGGRLNVHVTQGATKQLYERLHFYLPTELQKADSDNISVIHSDGYTPLDQMYLIPANPWLTKAKEGKSPQDSDDKKPAAK